MKSFKVNYILVGIRDIGEITQLYVVIYMYNCIDKLANFLFWQCHRKTGLCSDQWWF